MPAPPAEPVGPPPAAEAEPTESRYAASHILVAYAGATRAPASVTRPQEEAEARAEELWTLLEAGADFAGLARTRSDGPSAQRGGAIGVYRPGTMMPRFERVVAALEVGAYSRPFETAFGWHIARRDAVVEAEARHILVTWKGAVRSTQTRSKAQARAKIEAIEARLQGGEDFATVAREVGEDATAARGGDLGVVAKGQLVPAFEQAMFGLAPGQRSAIVETAYGYHLIERIR